MISDAAEPSLGTKRHAKGTVTVSADDNHNFLKPQMVGRVAILTNNARPSICPMSIP